MVKKIINILLVFVLLFPSFIIPDMRVHAQTLGDIERELEEYKAEYEENKNKQTQTEEEIAEAKRKIAKANQDIIDASNEIVRLNVEIEELNKEIEIKNEELKDIMNFFQKSNGESAYLEYAFGAKDFTDFIYRTAISEQLSRYNQKLITEYEEKIEENNKKAKELDDKKQELKNKQNELEELLSTLNQELESYQEDEVSIEEQIRMREDAIEMYKELGCTSEDDIDVCSRQHLPPTTELYRPLRQGYVTQEFGYPDYDTSSLYDFHWGIDMSTYDNDTPVYAAGTGLVVAVSRNLSCGNNIVYIQHIFKNGDTYTSAYWHMRRVFVSEGDTVTKDTQIGIMGGARSDHDSCAFGAHVHFVLATGLYLTDYYNFDTYRARRINPRTVVNFPPLYVDFTDRYIKY